jgi:hypothetical protein
LARNGFLPNLITSQSIERFGSPLMAESFQAFSLLKSISCSALNSSLNSLQMIKKDN